MVMRVDTSRLSWFGLGKALLPAEGDETYITRNEVIAVVFINTAGEGRIPSPRR
jgi:hypothetical protein